MSESAKERDDSARACGVLKVVSDDWTRWHFQSTADSAIYHTVDLLEWDCSGECSCPHFQMRIRPLLAGRVIKPHSEQAVCKHIRRANKILCYRVKRQLQRQLNPNPNRTRK